MPVLKFKGVRGLETLSLFYDPKSDTPMNLPSDFLTLPYNQPKTSI